jgi:hypothetical protein
MGPGGRGGSDGVAKSARIEPLKDFFFLERVIFFENRNILVKVGSIWVRIFFMTLA